MWNKVQPSQFDAFNCYDDDQTYDENCYIQHVDDIVENPVNSAWEKKMDQLFTRVQGSASQFVYEQNISIQMKKSIHFEVNPLTTGSYAKFNKRS